MTTSIHTFAGNIGIGTNDPDGFKLNVNGSVKADSLTVNGVTNSEVPIGLIALWYGTVSTIPSGWTLCDGVEVARTDLAGNITPPDLRTRFVRGAHQDNPAPAYPGQSGGANTVNLTEANLAPHTHTFTTDNHDAPHAHTASSANANAPHAHPASSANANAPHAHPASSGNANAPHNHGISDPTHAHTIPGYVQPMNYPPGSGIRELNPTGTVRNNTNSYGAYTGVSVQNAQAPHSHTITVNAQDAPHSHTITVNDQDAPHSHTITVDTGTAPHAHTGTTDSKGQATAVDIQNPYYVLAYIMKH
jgi:microcystin-dependent protein